MTLWSECHGINHLVEIDEFSWRVVESQSVLTSRNLVDTVEEYNILEDMLELSKPSVDKTKDYLIFTPFRYPPLKYGSRFGRSFESSLWYGSLDIETALSEVAYYRLLFLHHTEVDLGFINVPLTAFQALIKTKIGVDLCADPFGKYKDQLSSKNSYKYTQAIGTDMRETGVEAFVYCSARSLKEGKNIAAFSLKVFHRKNNHYTFNFQAWQCIASKKTVDLVGQDLKKISFTLDDFSYNSQLFDNPEWVGGS